MRDNQEDLALKQAVERYDKAFDEGELLEALDIYESFPYPSPLDEAGILAELYARSRDFPWHKTTAELQTRLSARADKVWEFIEADEHDYRFPRKLMKYSAQLVTAQGSSPEVIERALRYIDTCELFDDWEFRAEALQGIAKTADLETALRIYDVVFYEGLNVFEAMCQGEIPVYDMDGYQIPAYTNPPNTLLAMQNAIWFERMHKSEDPIKVQKYQQLLDGPGLISLFMRDAEYVKSEEFLMREVEVWRDHYGKFL